MGETVRKDTERTSQGNYSLKCRKDIYANKNTRQKVIRAMRKLESDIFR